MVERRTPRASGPSGIPPTGAPPAAAAQPYPWLAGLNPAQHRAATCLEGPVLVIAGAGTGKTRTLVHRLVHLVQMGVPAEAILLLTFTRRAAAEMIGRARELVGDRGRRLAGGTFHSLASTLLRRFGAAVGLPRNFTIIDQADSHELIGQLRQELKLAGGERAFPRRDTIANLISKSVNLQVGLAEVLADEAPHLLHELAPLEQLAERYRTHKQERGLVDFDDLLLLLVRLLRDHPAVRQRVHARFTHIMVDEYQDTNPLQAQATRLLAGPARHLMVVGDDAQSIYAFRGACFRNLFDFVDDFPDAPQIVLEENYRSVQPVLEVANALLGQMEQSFRKRLFTRREGGERPCLVRAADEEEQARWVGAEIVRLHAAGLPFHEIGVLFRASSHSYPLEVVLNRCKIPFVKYGGFRFMEAAHIKDVLAPLRVLANPADDLSLGRCLLQCRGIGPVGAHKLIARTVGCTDPARLGALLLQAAGKSKARPEVARVAHLLDALAAAREDPAHCLHLAVDDYRLRLKQLHDDWPRRDRDLEQLLQLAQHYQGLEQLLTDLTLDPPSTAAADQSLVVTPPAPMELPAPPSPDGQATGEQGRAPHPAAESDPAPWAPPSGTRRPARSGKVRRAQDAHEPEDQLVLSTLHSAKGLEWSVVFLLQALDGCIPLLAGGPFADEDTEQLDEELRLLYVGVTRARDRLALVWPVATARMYGGGWADPSRFLEALPSQLLARLLAQQPAARSTR